VCGELIIFGIIHQLLALNQFLLPYYLPNGQPFVQINANFSPKF